MKKIIVFLFLFMVCWSGFAQISMPDPLAPSYVSPRLSGLGAPFTTYQAGTETLFTNPALFPFLTKRWSAGKAAFHANEGGLGGLNSISESEKIKAFAEYLYKGDSKYVDFSATGPLALSLADKNFAVGIFNRSIVNADLENTIMRKLLIGEELFVTGGYGICLHDDGINKVSLGFQMKGFFQTFSYALNKTQIDMAAAVNSGFKNLNIVFVNGLGLDAGFLYKYDNYFFLGLTCRDAYTPVFLTPYNSFEDFKKANTAGKTEYKTLLPNLSVGIGSMPVFDDMWTTVSSWSFYIDYQNILEPIFNRNRSPLLNIAAGTEIVFHKVLSFRLGMNELYPHLGVGLDFTYFQIDFSAFLKEMGNKPWEKSKTCLDFAFSFEY
ncbi:hypothetical protein [Treponema putidum]|uniref:DUF5723 domain-containing protein n=1 Tax=Treponema putidum TaxID=221027 RepID=A0AAE9MT47_9SPIR|nr:hypothetical protein [Treponema putidum]AIN94453.1 hypothetical protein JO40_10420 [Treponema putidum]TWI78958.1 hypothetical protein JM98_00545 [Treponema putidum]UTY28455.1 hypothetical protein E4N76_05210 [Treponema putidum]UTY33321.1 hypothetical protein E4N74_04315 [Treponema putidum]